jgi:hypothetical protein
MYSYVYARAVQTQTAGLTHCNIYLTVEVNVVPFNPLLGNDSE